MINEYFTEGSALTSQYEKFFSIYNFYSNFLYNLGSNFLLMLAIIGILIIIGCKYKSQFNFSYISTTFILFGLIYAGTYIGLGYLFIPHRLLSFLQFFLVIFASFATYMIYTISSKKWIKFGLMGIVIFLIFFMITTPYINNGDAIYATDMVYRDQLLYSELKSLDWSNYFLENQTLFVDSLVSPRSISTIDTLNISPAQIEPYNPESHKNSINILVRQYVMTNPDLKLSGTFGTIRKLNYIELFSKVPQKYNLIYSNNYAMIYKNY